MPVIASIKATLSVWRGEFDMLTARIVGSPKIPRINLDGKRALVTGANVGIGKAVATSFAAQGAEVHLLCRNQERADLARDEIQQLTKNEKVFVEIVDFGSLASVRAFVDRWALKDPKDSRVDILINNAGIAIANKTTTADGLELVYQTNFLAPFLLTMLFLQRGFFTPSARIVQVSSQGLYGAPPVTPDHLNSDDFLGKLAEGELAPLKAGGTLYTRSKALQVIWTNELQRRLSRSSQWKDVAVQACHPGAVKSTIWHREDGLRQYPKVYAIVKRVISTIAISNEEGAITPVFLATAPEAALPEVRGRYWDRCRLKWLPAWVDDLSTRQALWAKWEEHAGVKLGDL